MGAVWEWESKLGVNYGRRQGAAKHLGRLPRAGARAHARRGHRPAVLSPYRNMLRINESVLVQKDSPPPPPPHRP
jgi:hypothetical protein